MRRLIVSGLVGGITLSAMLIAWAIAYRHFTGDQRPAREWGFGPGLWMGATTWAAYSTAFDLTWRSLTPSPTKEPA